jgi:hypothetical protein
MGLILLVCSVDVFGDLHGGKRLIRAPVSKPALCPWIANNVPAFPMP